MSMIKLLRTLTLLLAMAAIATHADAQSPFRKRCGTSMIQEREIAALAKGQTRAFEASQEYVPHSGTVAMPVILVNFKDVKLTVNNPREAFDQFLNGTTQNDLGNGNHYNFGSVAKYFSDMSSGEFSLKFKVYEPVTLDKDQTYYGGKNSNNNDDEKHQELVKDAVEMLTASGQVADEDIKSFCTNGKNIDCVLIIYAGCAQNEGGEASNVWANTSRPHSSTTMGGKNIRWYCMTGELAPYKLNDDGKPSTSNGTTPMIAGVGVTCHEFSHALGLPDFYPTAAKAQIDNQEMEYWDLMDGGEYAGNSFCPTAYTAFEKSEMGWQVDIKELNENLSVAIENSTEKGGTAYKITNPQNSNEYLMLECIQKRGWNSRQCGNGLLVYHVNRPSGDLTSYTRFNNTPGFPGMAVVPADGACLSIYIDENTNYYNSLYGDLFPGTGNMDPDTQNTTELSDAKPMPNFCWYNSSKTEKLATNKALQNIKYDTATGIVSFNYIHDVSTAISAVNADKGQGKRLYTIDGRYAGDDMNSLPHGIYIINGKKIIK